MNHEDFLAQERSNIQAVPSLEKVSVKLPPPSSLKRFYAGFRHAFKKNWLPLEIPKGKTLKSKYLSEGPMKIDKELTKTLPSTFESKFYTEIQRPYGKPGFAAGAGLTMGKYLPPVGVISGMLAGVDAGLGVKDTLKQELIVRPKQNKLFRDLADNDEVLKQAPRANLEDAYDTMKKITNNGESTVDKNLVRSFLRQSIAYEGVDYNTAKQIAETEHAIKKTKVDDSPLSNITRAIGSLATLTE